MVILMFVISACSAVMTIFLGWKQFYQDYLSKSIELPAWLLLLVILVAPIVVAIYKSITSDSPDKELLKVEGKEFGVQQVLLDGKSFERCVFDGTEIVFEGQGGFSLISCNFPVPPRVSFTKAAGTTLMVLTNLYRDPAFRPLIERTIENILAGSPPRSIPPAEPT